MSSEPLYSDRTGDPETHVRVEIRLYGDGLAEISVAGTGSVAGMRAFASSFERGLALLPTTRGIRVHLVLSDFQGAPIAAQLALVKWMIHNQRRIQFIGILGGESGAIRVARAIQRLLPFGHRLGFYQQEEPLLAKLEAVRLDHGDDG